MPIEILPGTAHDEADYALDPEVLEALWRMEEAHFWHAARNRWILAALRARGVRAPARVLEVGCGSGAVAVALAEAGYTVTGVDTALPLVQRAHARAPHLDWVVGRVEALPERPPYAALGFFDVLEHLEDPVRLLVQTLPFAEPGALVLATVPADRSLFSTIDTLSGHKRRCEPGELAALLERAGLVEGTEHGIFRALRPLQRWRRRGPLASDPEALGREEQVALMREDLRVPSALLNRLLRWVCDAERRVGFSFSAGRTGGTLLGMARVPAPSEPSQGSTKLSSR